MLSMYFHPLYLYTLIETCCWMAGWPRKLGFCSHYQADQPVPWGESSELCRALLSLEDAEMGPDICSDSSGATFPAWPWNSAREVTGCRAESTSLVRGP